MATGKFAIQGMQGANDAERVTRALREVWGIQEVALQPDKAEVTFKYDERAASYEDFQTALQDHGFGVLPLDKEGAEKGRDQNGQYL